MDCRKCKVPMAPSTATIEGAARDLWIKVSDYPYYRCERCGARANVDPDFDMYLIDSIDDATPTADTDWRGRTSSCSKCHADFAPAAAALQTLGATLHVRKTHTVGVVVQAPGFACPSCGTRQLQGGEDYVTSNIADALIEAFKMLGPIRPSKRS